VLVAALTFTGVFGLPASAVAAETFRATLTGPKEVPVCSTTGRGELELTIPDDQSRIDFALAYELEGSVTVAHIHLGKRTEAGGASCSSVAVVGNPLAHPPPRQSPGRSSLATSLAPPDRASPPAKEKNWRESCVKAGPMPTSIRTSVLTAKCADRFIGRRAAGDAPSLLDVRYVKHSAVRSRHGAKVTRGGAKSLVQPWEVHRRRRWLLPPRSAAPVVHFIPLIGLGCPPLMHQMLQMRQRFPQGHPAPEVIQGGAEDLQRHLIGRLWCAPKGVNAALQAAVVVLEQFVDARLGVFDGRAVRG